MVAYLDEAENEKPRELSERENWPQNNLEYKGLKVGQIAGVAIETTGDVVIFHRSDRTWGMNTFDSNEYLNSELRKEPITEDPVWFLKKESGVVTGTWGGGKFYFPHGLTIDHHNNMWFTDVGMHQIFKYSRDGKELLKLGEKFVPGNDKKHFCKPTDVAVERDGSFFVSDGYCNSRVLKFSPDGIVRMIINDDDLLRAELRVPIFRIPHGLSLDHDRGVLYIADRENGRVLTFDSKTGRYGNHYEGFGDKAFAICFSPNNGGLLYVINGQSPRQPFIYGSTINLKSKEVIQQWQPETRFSYPHDITCDPSGKVVYVSEITAPGRLWKFQQRT